MVTRHILVLSYSVSTPSYTDLVSGTDLRDGVVGNRDTGHRKKERILYRLVRSRVSVSLFV